jgi:hypothetical protein
MKKLIARWFRFPTVVVLWSKATSVYRHCVALLAALADGNL